MKRILNSSKRLHALLDKDQDFYIGFGANSLLPFTKANNGINDLISGLTSSFIVTGKLGALKENTEGKMVRIQPEHKISIWKHICYFSKKFNKKIEYDREFFIWEKEVAHKFNLALTTITSPQDETILCFPKFTMKEDENLFLQVRAAMNMSIALSSYYQIYDSKLEPILAVTNIELKQLLKNGTISVSDKLFLIGEEIKNTDPGRILSKGNSYRFAALTEKEPSGVTIGSGGFNEYLMFEFTANNLVVYENLKSGNATFMFSGSTFDKKKDLDKQNALADPAFLKRIIHTNLKAWSRQFNVFFNQ